MRPSGFPAHVVVRTSLQIILVCLMNCAPGGAQTPADASNAQKSKIQTVQASEANWPRTIRSGPDTFLIYEPQAETWDGNCGYPKCVLYRETEKGLQNGISPFKAIFLVRPLEIGR